MDRYPRCQVIADAETHDLTRALIGGHASSLEGYRLPARSVAPLPLHVLPRVHKDLCENHKDLAFEDRQDLAISAALLPCMVRQSFFNSQITNLDLKISDGCCSALRNGREVFFNVTLIAQEMVYDFRATEFTWIHKNPELAKKVSARHLEHALEVSRKATEAGLEDLNLNHRYDPVDGLELQLGYVNAATFCELADQPACLLTVDEIQHHRLHRLFLLVQDDAESLSLDRFTKDDLRRIAPHAASKCPDDETARMLLIHQKADDCLRRAGVSLQHPLLSFCALGERAGFSAITTQYLGKEIGIVFANSVTDIYGKILTLVASVDESENGKRKFYVSWGHHFFR